MRIIALEEHFIVPALVEKKFPNSFQSKMSPEIQKALGDLGNSRITAMDDGHISVQVISAAAPGADQIDGKEGIMFARATNDTLGEAAKRLPSRYAGFAHLPMREPKAAAEEFERAVKDLHFCGALINGTTQGLFLDDKKFAPILAMAEKLDVPLYLHPALPPEAVRKAYYDGLPDGLGFALSMAGFGWHIEVAIHVLRLVLSQTFTEYPKLKVIIGHMGETLPFMLDRAEQVFQSQPKPVSVKEVILRHVWITTSGFFTIPPFLNALEIFGPEKILFSVDYPFSSNRKGYEFLKQLPVSAEVLEKISYRNAEQLLKLAP